MLLAQMGTPPRLEEYWDFDDQLECACGGWAKPKRISLEFDCRGRKVTISDLPVYRCEECGEIVISGLTDIRIEELLDIAVRNGMTTIAFTL